MIRDDHFHAATAFAVSTGTAMSTISLKEELYGLAVKVAVSVVVGLISAGITKLLGKLSQKFGK